MKNWEYAEFTKTASEYGGPKNFLTEYGEEKFNEGKLVGEEIGENRGEVKGLIEGGVLTVIIGGITFGVLKYRNDKAEPRLLQVDKEFTSVVREISLSSVLESGANLQGVAYDSQDDCLWLAVGKSIVTVSKDGEIIRSIDMGKYVDSLTNGIVYNPEDDSLWVLCASNYLLHISKDGTVLEELPFHYADQDHITIIDGYLYITVGADYHGENNFIAKVSPQNGRIVRLYKTEGANALEGICVYNGKVMIVNDGLYHSDLVGHSYITVYSDEILKQ